MHSKRASTHTEMWFVRVTNDACDKKLVAITSGIDLKKLTKLSPLRGQCSCIVHTKLCRRTLPNLL